MLIGKSVMRSGKGNVRQEEDVMPWIIWVNIFSFAPSFKQNQNN